MLSLEGAKVCFLISAVGVVLNAVACMFMQNLALWWSGIVIFLIGAVGVLVCCKRPKREEVSRTSFDPDL